MPSKELFKDIDIESRTNERTTGGRIKKFRKALHLSQAALGEKVGSSHGSIAGYEMNQHTPSARVLSGLASVFNTSEAYLLCATDDPSPNGTVSKHPISVELDRIIEKATFLKLEAESVYQIKEKDIQEDAAAAMGELMQEVKDLCIRPDVVPASIPDRIRSLKKFIHNNADMIDGLLGGKIEAGDK